MAKGDWCPKPSIMLEHENVIIIIVTCVLGTCDDDGKNHVHTALLIEHLHCK